MSSPKSFSGDGSTPPDQQPPAYPAYQSTGAGPDGPAPDAVVHPYYSPHAGPTGPGPDTTGPVSYPAPGLTEPGPAGMAVQEPAPQLADPVTSGQRPRKHSRIGAAWVALIVAAIVLIFLLIFVVQNSQSVDVQYFGFQGTLSLGVALLFAAIAGALTAGLLGTVRILQLRSRARRIAAGK